LLNAATPVREADAASFEFPLDLLLRTPVTLIRQVLPLMLERGDGAVLFGLPINASMPAPPFGNIGTAAAAARHYLHTLHADLAGTGVYAGLLQISGPVGDSDAGNFVLENYDPALLPEPQNPADLADAMWDLYLKHDGFDQVFGA
jgi:NAD(P)-dependent dehydrogenase (short-subunit alcohol dehydrogenase family)